MENKEGTTAKSNGAQSKADQPTIGLIQEVAIGTELSGQMLQENQIKRG